MMPTASSGPVVFVVFAVAGTIAWLIWTRNNLIALRAARDAAWASIDALLKRRTDLVPQLVTLVKGAMTYESDTLTRVTEARGGAVDAESARRLIAVVEQYPELKANAQILRLQEQLTETENDIASARRYFNAVVRDYNIHRESFPTMMVASLLGFTPATYFEVDDEERAVPGGLR
jgi:LemA protein